MGRTTVNLVGNCVATVVIARWEKAFDYDKMRLFIRESNEEEAESIADIKQICDKVTNKIEGQ